MIPRLVTAESRGLLACQGCVCFVEGSGRDRRRELPAMPSPVPCAAAKPAAYACAADRCGHRLRPSKVLPIMHTSQSSRTVMTLVMIGVDPRAWVWQFVGRLAVLVFFVTASSCPRSIDGVELAGHTRIASGMASPRPRHDDRLIEFIAAGPCWMYSVGLICSCTRALRRYRNDSCEPGSAAFATVVVLTMYSVSNSISASC